MAGDGEDEEAWIGAIQDRNIIKVCGLLKPGDGIIHQLEALNLSIHLGNNFDFSQIHEALLVAIDIHQPCVVKMLLNCLDQEKSNKMDVQSFSLAIFDHSIDDLQFAPA
ncbi:short transient receptor potential channel 2-like [Salvelinus alpinus]|uniref:short transient receptor potential channel 2-like n=1 Tax=Salvelinus alpinus TaxID=8036 RepID=UPI0039FD3E25